MEKRRFIGFVCGVSVFSADQDESWSISRGNARPQVTRGNLIRPGVMYWHCQSAVLADGHIGVEKPLAWYLCKGDRTSLNTVEELMLRVVR